MITLLLLVMLVGTVFFNKGVSSQSAPRQEVQVINRQESGSVAPTWDSTNRVIGSQPITTYQGLNYDSLAQRVLFVIGPTIIPDISNYNNMNFIYEDSLLTENVVQILDETSERFADAVALIAAETAKELGLRFDLLLKTLAKKQELEAKAYLAWPIFVVLSLMLLFFATKTERLLLQYIAGALLVATVIGSLCYLPDIVIGLSTDDYDVYKLIKAL